MQFTAVFVLCVLAQAQTSTSTPNTAAPKPEPAPYKPEELCAIEGIVRNHITGEPLKKANVTAMRADITPGMSFPPSTTSTNAEGKFAMNNIEPGQYRLSGVSAGSVDVSNGTDVSWPLSLRRTATPFGSASAATIGECVDTNVCCDNAWIR